MIKKELITAIFAARINIEQYAMLSFINRGISIEDLAGHFSLRGALLALQAMGLLTVENIETFKNVVLTPAGDALITKIDNPLLSQVEKKLVAALPAPAELPAAPTKLKVKEAIKKISANQEVATDEWRSKLFKKIEQMIIDQTLSSNIMNPSGKYYKPMEDEFVRRFDRLFKKFGYIPESRLEECIIGYTQKVISKQIKFPIKLIYYLWEMKDGTFTSPLMEEIDMSRADSRKTPIKPKNTDDQF